jgi:hypothetical protein
MELGFLNISKQRLAKGWDTKASETGLGKPLTVPARMGGYFHDSRSSYYACFRALERVLFFYCSSDAFYSFEQRSHVVCLAREMRQDEDQIGRWT